MNKEHYISHGQDLTDAINEIRNMRPPYVLTAWRTHPNKEEHPDENKKIRRLQAYFFRSVVPTLSSCAGCDYAEAEGILRSRYLKAGEVVIDSDGNYDIMWIEKEVFYSFTEGKKYRVQSIGDLSVPELIEFVDASKLYILMRWGVHCPEFIREFKTKEI